MEPLYATELVNFFPDAGRVESRRGYEQYADVGSMLPVETLVSHLGGAMRKLFAVTSEAVYNVTDPEAITTDVNTGITAGRWRSATLNRNTVMVNGTDAPLRHDESGAWVPHGFTGTVTPSNLTQITAFQNRLFFLEKDSSKLWYGDLSHVTGELNDIDLGLVASQAGNAVAIGSLTLDTGQGVDDLLAIFMERGHVLVYAGTDPSNASTWALSGIFHLGPVIGDRPLVRLGADLIAITSDGYIPVLQFLQGGRQQTNLAISDAISSTVADAVRRHRNVPGWQPILHTPAKWLLINVPTAEATQHVMNAQTGAWTRFTGMDARCWETFGDDIFFGAPGGLVHKADFGTSDNGTAIRAVGRTAYSMLGSPYDKQIRAVRPFVESEGATTQFATGISVDYVRSVPRLSAGVLSEAGTLWDTALWDTFLWAAGSTRSREWRGVSEQGAAVAVHMLALTSGDPLRWFSTDILFDQLQGSLAVV